MVKAFPEVSFIVCRRRKNRPKIPPLVCENRCQHIKVCPDYFDYIQPAMFGRCEKREAGKRIKK
ncbi:MAG: hypothetical protein MUP68_14185 [Deltaproteobacteria bacterium]|nr:hypothetical protein [Deltaproteobacteria bacterium]